MAITGNVPTSQFNRGAFQELYRHYQADFPSTVRTMCKKVFQPTRGDMVALAVRQAWKTMVTGRPGPVVLDVPFDIFKEAAAEETPNPRGMERQHLVALRRRSGRRDQDGRHAACRQAAGHPRGAGRALRRRRGGAAGAGGEAADPGGGVGERARRAPERPSAVARARLTRRRLSGEPRREAGRRAAGARRALRRPHLELMDSGLLVHDPADQAHPRGHRPGGDRAQLSGRARADGGRAHLPAPGAGGAREPQDHRCAGGSAQGMARSDRRLPQGMGRAGGARLQGRRDPDQSAARGLRDRPRAARGRASWSATSACTTTGCCSSASRSARTR